MGGSRRSIDHDKGRRRHHADHAAGDDAVIVEEVDRALHAIAGQCAHPATAEKMTKTECQRRACHGRKPRIKGAGHRSKDNDRRRAALTDDKRRTDAKQYPRH